MTQIRQIEAELSRALGALRAALADRDTTSAPSPEDAGLRERVSVLEEQNAALTEELERLQEKRDKDVAALDELIAQLKPLIEEV